jgi:hypothetical protein
MPISWPSTNGLPLVQPGLLVEPFEVLPLPPSEGIKCTILSPLVVLLKMRIVRTEIGQSFFVPVDFPLQKLTKVACLYAFNTM